MEKEISATTLTDMLLCIPTRQRQTKLVNVKELSEKAGKSIYFQLSELDYDTCAYLRGKGEDMDACIVCMGVTAPLINSEEFAQSQGVDMPQDALKKYLSAGTIESLAREIERLSGYRQISIETVKKK